MGPFHNAADDSSNNRAGGWSPDGRHIVYSVKVSEDDRDIWVIDANGKKHHPLVSGPAIQMAPDWSPDGKVIVFQSNLMGNHDIWVMELN